MAQFSYPQYPTQPGYLTEAIRGKYIEKAVAQKLLPKDAHRMPHVLSLTAPNDVAKPIQFWQLYSVLGSDRILKIVGSFYQRVFNDEDWFTSVFARVGGVGHHIQTQSAMWIDVMGGGMAYHGGEFRLNFHHTHNAMQLMNEKGAKRWVALMVATLNDPAVDLTDDPRVLPALNTFLSHFLDKYADEFKFANTEKFGELNQPLRKRINFLKLSSDAIEALSEEELKDELAQRGIDVSEYRDKSQLVNKALSL